MRSRARPILGEVDRFRLEGDEIGKCRLEFCQSWANLAGSGSNSADVGQHRPVRARGQPSWHNCGRSRPLSGEGPTRIRPMLGAIGRSWQNSANVVNPGQNSTNVARVWPLLAQTRADLENADRFGSDFGQYWAKLANSGPPSANCGSSWQVLARVYGSTSAYLRKIDQCCSYSAEFQQSSSPRYLYSANSGRHRPILARVRSMLGEIGQFPT